MTTYHVRVRFHHSGRETVWSFNSATERAMAIIGYGAGIDVIEEWVSSREERAL